MTDNSNQLIAILEIGFYVCLAMGFVFLIILSGYGIRFFDYICDFVFYVRH